MTPHAGLGSTGALLISHNLSRVTSALPITQGLVFLFTSVSGQEKIGRAPLPPHLGPWPKE